MRGDLIGSADFRGQYVLRQPRNLFYLSHAAGVGRERLRVSLRGVRRNGALIEPVMYSQVARMAFERGLMPLRPIPADEDGLCPDPSITPSRFLDFTAQLLKEDVDRIRAALAPELGPLQTLQAEWRARMVLRRPEWPLLLAWINNHLSRREALSLSCLAEVVVDASGQVVRPHPVTYALLRLRAQDAESGALVAYLPALALEILQHAVRYGLAEMHIEERDPSGGLLLWERAHGDDDLERLRQPVWSGLDEEQARLERAVVWAGRGMHGAAARELMGVLSDPSARLIRGLIAVMRGEHAQARADLLAASRAPSSDAAQARLEPLLRSLRPALEQHGLEVPATFPELPRLASVLLLDFEARVHPPVPRHRMQALRRYLSFFPEDIEKRAEQCALLLALDQPAEALAAVTVPGVVSDRLQRLRAAALLKMGRPGRALAALQGVRVTPSDAILRAETLAALSRPREALTALRDAANTVEALGLAARLHRLLEQPTDAAEAERQLLDRANDARIAFRHLRDHLDALTPSETNLWRRAAIWKQRGEWARALDDYTRLQEIHPTSVPALRCRARALLELDRPAEARDLLGQQPALRGMWLQAAADAGEPCPAAIVEISARLERVNRAEQARLLRLRAQLRRAAGDGWGAREDIAASLALKMTAEGLAWRGVLLAEAGWLEEARACFLSAKRRDPGLAFVQERLDGLQIRVGL